MTQEMSYEQVYELFGYQQNLRFSVVLDSLLYAVCPSKDFNRQNYQGFENCGVAGYMLTKNSPLVELDMKAAGEVFLKSLGKKTPFALAYKMNLHLHTMHHQRRILNELPWYAIRRRRRLRSSLKKLGNVRISVQSVIQYFEYRAHIERIEGDEFYRRCAQFIQKKA